MIWILHYEKDEWAVCEKVNIERSKRRTTVMSKRDEKDEKEG
jgi:hypothetical protein